MNKNIAWCCNAIPWVFVIIAIADFCGMFFGYDFTGYKYSPVLFGAAATLFFNLAEKTQKSKKNSDH